MESEQVVMTSILALIFALIQFSVTFYITRKIGKSDKKREMEEAKRDQERRTLEANQKAKDDYQVTIARGVKALLHAQIHHESNRLLVKGWATGDEKRGVEYLYSPYKALGGNGTAASVYHEVMELTTLTPPSDRKNSYNQHRGEKNERDDY